MEKYIKGIILGVLLFSFYIFFSSALGIWISIVFALSITVLSLGIYIRKKQIPMKESLWISLIAGLTYALISSLAISLFPPEEIRDVGDIVMPYLNALTFTVIAIFVYIALGMALSRK